MTPEHLDRLHEYLNQPHPWLPFTEGWRLRTDPVRTKNLEKCAGFLYALRPALANPAVAARLEPLLKQLADPRRISFDSAWELADALERALIEHSDEAFVRTRFGAELLREKHPATMAETKLTDLLAQASKEDGAKVTLDQVRAWLLQRQDELVTAYRRDRALMRLRGLHLHWMGAVLAVLLVLACAALYLSMCSSSNAAALPSTLAMVTTAGAIGSVLSRAYQLGKQPLPTEPQGPEPPLGVRTLLSARAIFLPQLVIGATAAFVVFLVFYAGVLRIGDIALTPAHYGLLAFLAGFSEPFFLRIVEKVEATVK